MLKRELRDHLSRSFSDEELRQWFDPLAVNRMENRVEVTFPHPFFAAWFGEHFQSRFEAQLAQILGAGWTIGYRRNGAAPDPRAGQPDAEIPVVGAPRHSRAGVPFGAQFTFDTFLVNKKNSFPLEAAKRVANQTLAEYNPLVVCGESGTGKTHLLRAMANAAARREQPATVWLGSPEDIAAVYAKHHGDGHGARATLLGFEMLLLDDLQQLRDFPELRQELISLFNAFHDRRRQMVFASAERIGKADFLDDTLRSRLEWGLKLTLAKPDLDIRVRLAQTYCKERRLSLSPDQLLTLAQRFDDLRTLQGVLLKFSAYKEMMRADIDQRGFEQILSHTEEVARPSITPEGVIAVVADRFGVGIKDIKGAQRHQNVAQARQLAMYLCRELLGISFPALGRAFGGKDHSTVLYAVKKVNKLRRDDPEVKRLLMELEDKCTSATDEGA